MTGPVATDPNAPAPQALHPQQASLARWAALEGRRFASPEVAELYRQRTRRFVDIIELKVPDRVPALMTAAGLVTRHAGISFGDSFYNAERAGMAALKFCEDFRPSTRCSPAVRPPGRPSTCWATRPTSGRAARCRRTCRSSMSRPSLCRRRTTTR